MEITIIETGDVVELSIIDPKSGCDWTQDLMGNYGALPDYDEETYTYHMSQEDYDWWADLIDRYQSADDRYYQICQELDYEERGEFEAIVQTHCGGVDLEAHPEALQQACDEWEGITED